MTRKSLITILKFALVAGLITFVFFKIELVDKIVELDAAGEAVSTLKGSIIGPWDSDVVEFRDAETGKVEKFVVGKRDDGTSLNAIAGFWSVIKNLNLWLFAAGAACYLFSLVFSSIRWWWLLKVNQVDCSIVDSIRFTWIGVFFNNVVPGQTGGDVVKALYIMRHAGNSGRVAAVVSVLVDRVLGLASLALLGAVVVLFFLDEFPSVAIGVWSVLIGVILMGVVAFSKRIRRAIRLDALLKNLPLSGVLQKLDQAVYFYRTHKSGMVLWLFLGVANHAVSVTSIMLVGEALDVGMEPYGYFVLIPIINIASAVPIGPAGWGVGEFLYGSLFGAFGAKYVENAADPETVMATRAVALSVLYRLHLMAWSMVGGLLTLTAKERVTRADVEDEIARGDDPVV